MGGVGGGVRQLQLNEFTSLFHSHPNPHPFYGERKPVYFRIDTDYLSETKIGQEMQIFRVSAVDTLSGFFAKCKIGIEVPLP